MQNIIIRFGFFFLANGLYTIAEKEFCFLNPAYQYVSKCEMLHDIQLIPDTFRIIALLDGPILLLYTFLSSIETKIKDEKE